MSKRVRVILLIISIIAIVALATYAWIIWNSPNNTELTMQIGQVAEVKFTKGNDISTSNMGPVLNPEIDGEITTFSVKNRMNYDYAIDININITSIADELKSESLKYMILSSTTENGTYTSTSSGSFANKIVGNNLVGGSTIKANATTYFKFILYIDGSIENNTNLMGKAINATLNVTASVKEPNSPALTDNLIPVKYDSTNSRWVKADSSNANNDWYNYNDKKWANAVLVSSTNRSTYVNGDVGTVIPESDVLAYYVWIPRYKYKVWNIDKTIGVDSYNAQTVGIDIIFEQGTASTGTISCNYDFTITDGSLSEICTGSNGYYYTHPAFTFGDDEITGFWVGKFELTGTSSNPTILPNSISINNQTITSFYKMIKDMGITNNNYGISTNMDSHLLKNMEWGAIAYLTHSKYGRCSNNTCTTIGVNDFINENEVSTGGGNYITNINQSTTDNIYGIYDLSGGLYEYVMGNMSEIDDTYTFYPCDGGSNFIYGNDTSKYIDIYARGSTYNNQTAYNRARLGDATGEVLVSSNRTWNNDFASFVSNSYPWFERGGFYGDGEQAGLFRVNRVKGIAGVRTGARSVLLKSITSI